MPQACDATAVAEARRFGLWKKKSWNSSKCNLAALYFAPRGPVGGKLLHKRKAGYPQFAASMRAGRRCCVLGRLLEEPDGSGAKERQDGGPAEDVHVGQEGGLLLHLVVEESKTAGAGGGGAQMVAQVS